MSVLSLSVSPRPKLLCLTGSIVNGISLHYHNPDLLKPFVFLSLPSALASPQPIVLALLWWVWIKPFSKSDSTVVQRRMSPVRFHLMNITEVKVKAGHRGDNFFFILLQPEYVSVTHTKTHTQCYVFLCIVRTSRSHNAFSNPNHYKCLPNLNP